MYDPVLSVYILAHSPGHLLIFFLCDPALLYRGTIYSQEETLKMGMLHIHFIPRKGRKDKETQRPQRFSIQPF